MNIKKSLIILVGALLISSLSFYGGLKVAVTQKNETIDMLNKLYATHNIENETSKMNIHLFYMESIDKEINKELVEKARHFVKMSLIEINDLSSKDMLERPQHKSILKSAEKFVNEAN